MNEKTSFLLPAKNEVHCVDTHSYPPHGPNVIVSDSVNMAKLCKTVLGLQGHSENTFGDLAFV